MPHPLAKGHIYFEIKIKAWFKSTINTLFCNARKSITVTGRDNCDNIIAFFLKLRNARRNKNDRLFEANVKLNRFKRKEKASRLLDHLNNSLINQLFAEQLLIIHKYVFYENMLEKIGTNFDPLKVERRYEKCQ